jgi:hypothetical protein
MFQGVEQVCVCVLTDSILNAYPFLHLHSIQNLSQRHVLIHGRKRGKHSSSDGVLRMGNNGQQERDDKVFRVQSSILAQYS